MGKVTTLVPWFGTNRSLAHHVGEQLQGCEWVGVPFAGGMCELRHLTARTIVVGDLHRHVINLANVLKCSEFGAGFIQDLRRTPFHEDELKNAQHRCRLREERQWNQSIMSEMSYEAARDYFVAAWMGRNGVAGTGGEFKSGLSVRWDAGGGDSAVRFRSAVESLRDWRRIMPRCTFVVRDCFEFLDSVKDRGGHGCYCDPPFPDAGDAYKHKFTEAHQRRLAEKLSSFGACTIVARFYRHPLIEELYPQSAGWRWLDLVGGKTQANKAAPEVLLVKNDTEVEA